MPTRCPFFLKVLNFFLFTLFRPTCFGHHCVHHQELLSCTCSLWSLSIIRNTCYLQICHYVHFIVTTYYLCGTYKPFFNLYVCFVLFCFRLWLCGICFLYYIIVTYRVVLGWLCSPVLLCCNCIMTYL